MPERGLNKVMLIGRVGQDPDLRYTQSGTAVVVFSLATNEVWKDANGETQQRTEWHRIEAWKRLAEVCAEYVKKGSKLYLAGSLKTDEWQDQQGVTKRTTKIRVNEMLMLDSPDRANNQTQSQPRQHGFTPPQPEDDSPF